jgi:hypothetical protein
MRFPTGDDKNLLGTGTMATKLFFVGSTEYGSISPHLNLGYTLVSGSSSIAEDIPDEANYAVGVDFAPTRRCTLNVDFVGRIEHDAQRVESSTRLWERFPDAMKPAMARHDAILREAVERSAGRVVKTTGDASAVYRSLLLFGTINATMGEPPRLADSRSARTF